MVQGMSRDAWDEFSKTILVRYVLTYLCGTLYLDPSASLKRIFAFSVGSLFSLSTHALTCPRRGKPFVPTQPERHPSPSQWEATQVNVGNPVIQQVYTTHTPSFPIPVPIPSARGTQRGYSSKPLNIALLNVF